MAIRRFSNSSIATGAKSSKLWDGETFPGYFESIATVTLSSASASVDFNSLPTTYTHLQLRYSIVSQAGTNDFSLGMNGSFSIPNSSSHIMFAYQGNGVSAQNQSSFNFVTLHLGLSASVPSTHIMSGIVDILDYRNTNKTKTIRHMFCHNRNTDGFVALSSGNLNSTSAMTSLNLYNGYNWGAGTTFELYGIRGA